MPSYILGGHFYLGLNTSILRNWYKLFKGFEEIIGSDGLVLDYRNLTSWVVAIVMLVPSVWVNSAQGYVGSRTMAAISGSALRYCIDPDWLPYEALIYGKHTGLSADYLNAVSSTLSLTLTLVPTTSWSESLSFLQQGKCDLTPLLNITPERERYLLFSDSYFEAPNVLVSLKSEPFLQGFENIGNRSLIVPSGYRLVEYIQQYYPNVRLLFASSEKDGLEKVARGEADVFVGSMFSVNAYIQQKGLTELKISGWGGPPDELRFGVVKSQGELIPKLNYALKQISEEQKLAIYRKWHNVAIIDSIDYDSVIRMLLIFAGVISLLLYRNYLVQKHASRLECHNAELEALRQDLETKNQELNFWAQHDPLTLLYNRYYFNRRFVDITPHPPINGPVCIIIIDIDYFKAVNDNFGHSAGDKVLTLVAAVLKLAVRESDVVARWGGEEFVLVCPSLGISQTCELCKRIATEIEATDFGCEIKITCSFGIAKLKLDEAMMDCLDRADKALYQAKSGGRNQICTEESLNDLTS